MKKVAVCVLLLGVIVGVALLFGNHGEENGYLRVHIRANSNESVDQTVKYKVRDAVVEYLTPTVAECGTKEEAMQRVKNELPAIERTAERVLSENGFSYGARASLRREEFPTRVYENVTLEAGVYDALILELGTGTGDNWWCVVYPPLCFTSGGGNIIYRSKIMEIIRSFFA